MKDLIIVGRLGSGKTSFAQFLHKKLRYPVYEVGDIVREECARNWSAETPLEFAVKKFDEFGKDYFTKKLLNKMDREDRNIIVGIRSTEELNCLRSALNEIIIIGITANIEVRRERYEISCLSKTKNSDFYDREEIEEKWGIDEVIGSADITVKNNGDDFDMFTRSAEDILIHILEKRNG